MKAESHLFTPPHNTRLFVILGPFGSGKTEISLNLALALHAQGRQTALCDLDIVNPYFRSREKEDMLEEEGISLIAPEGALRHADLPSIPPAFRQVVYSGDVAGVLDVGGDLTGARVLGGYALDITRQDPAVWYVFNQSRYDNVDLQASQASFHQIQAQSGIRINGILHNTHLIADTTADTLMEGVQAARRFALETKLPLICHCARQDLVPELADLSPLFPLHLFMNRPWEDG